MTATNVINTSVVVGYIARHKETHAPLPGKYQGTLHKLYRGPGSAKTAIKLSAKPGYWQKSARFDPNHYEVVPVYAGEPV